MRGQLPANRLKELRQGRELKTYDIASELRVDPGTVWRWENGATQVPDWAKLRLAALFGVTPSYLMGWEEVAA